MHAIRTLVLLIVAGASIAKPLARHARHSGTHHPQKVHPIPVAHGKSKATRQDRGQPAAGQRQCQPLVKNGEISPAASMVDPTIKLLLMSSPKAGATLVERLMLARVNLTGAAVHFKGYPLRYSHEVFQQAKGRLPTPGQALASTNGKSGSPTLSQAGGEGFSSRVTFQLYIFLANQTFQSIGSLVIV